MLRFLGPSTTLDGESVRPHDLDVVGAGEGAPATVTEVATLGFEIRISLRLDDGQQVWAQTSRSEYHSLGVGVGDHVGVRRRAGASTVHAPRDATGDAPGTAVGPGIEQPADQSTTGLPRVGGSSTTSVR